MLLSETKIRNSKPRDKRYKIADGKGLFLVINPNGSKYWRLRYHFNGKEKLLALGVYPHISLADAREKHADTKKLLAKGIDPSVEKQTQKRTTRLLNEHSFETIAREWFAKYSVGWTKDHGERILTRLEKDIFPWIGHLSIAEITAPQLLTALRRVENRGAIETAHRAHQNCSQIFRYAIAIGKAERDPAGDLRGALPPVKKRHHASITEANGIRNLLLTIREYQGYFVTKCALKLSPLLFVRPGELRQAEWSEFDFAKAEWRIPAAKMKMRETHIVPLSAQAINILQELQPLTSHGQYVFPSIRSLKRPMSNNTVNGALRRLGYTTDEMTAHGFRSMASTVLNEQGWHRDAIERQLAHAERNSVRAAYNYAEHLPERRKMMQHWADYLDSLMTDTEN